MSDVRFPLDLRLAKTYNFSVPKKVCFSVKLSKSHRGSLKDNLSEVCRRLGVGAFLLGENRVRPCPKKIMKRAEKPLFVQNLTEELKSSSAIVVINYQGLTVKLQQELKKRLKAVGAKMLVVKNTLFRLASKEAKVAEEITSDTVLSGPTAIVVTESDPIAPLQVLAKFASEFEIPQFKVGIVEGKFQDKENLIALSKLPPKNVLFGQVLGTISSPLYTFAFTLENNLQKLVFILNEASKK